MGLPACPFENFKTRFPGHIDVQEDQEREGMAFAVGEGPLAGEVIESLLTIRHGGERVGRAGDFESVLKKEDVVLLVFGVKDYACGIHRRN
jgi:hypothetical protein